MPRRAPTTSPAASRPSLIDLEPRKKLAVMLAVLMGLFLAALDQTIVGTALPRIVKDLNGSNLYTWVVTAYLLSSTITVPIYGKFGDVFGRKAMLLVGVGLFLVGSALSGLAQNMSELILFRGLQGLGAGALFPVSLAIIGDMFTPRERGRYQGVFGAVFGLSFIIGPFLGGFLTDNVSWHWVFYVNLPIGLIALVVITSVLPNVHMRTASVRDLDYLGIAVFSLGVIPVLIGLTDAGLVDAATGQQQYGLGSWQVGGLVVVGIVVLVGFVFVERGAREPIIPLELFRDRTFSATNAATFMVAFGMFASVVFIPRFYQVVEGDSATRSGYMIWPLLVGLIGASIGAGILVSRVGRYRTLLLGAMAIEVLGMFLMTHLAGGTSTQLVWVWMFAVGLGIGPAMSVFTVVVQNSAPLDRLGAATSTLTFVRQIGGSVGLAIAGTLFNQTLTSQLPQVAQQQGLTPRTLAVIHSCGVDPTSPGLTTALVQTCHTPAPLAASLVEVVHTAFATAVASIFWIGVLSGLVAVLAALLIRDVPLRGSRADDAAAPVPAQEPHTAVAAAS